MDKAEEFLANNNNKKKLRLMLHGGGGRLKSVSCSDIYVGKKADEILKSHDQPYLSDYIDHKEHNFNVVGSYNGLLLVVASYGDGRGTGHRIYIWNPKNFEYKLLPELKSCIWDGSIYGFGPDLTTTDSDNINNNHYKVLFLDTVKDDYSKTCPRTLKMHVYTTRTNSWKTVDQYFGPYGYLYSRPTGMILAYNNLHFRAQRHDFNLKFGLYQIISFDLNDEHKFSVLPEPPRGEYLQICTLKTDLCAFSYNSDTNCYIISRMDGFGDKHKERWTDIYSIDPRLAVDKPIHFVSPMHILDDSQILLYAMDFHPAVYPIIPFIVSYNTESQKGTVIANWNGPFWAVPVLYEESSISPRPAAYTVEEELPGQALKRRIRTYHER